MSTTQPTTAGTFTAERRTLAAALARITTTAPNNSPKPVLQAVRVSVNGSVELYATDIERWHNETIPADDKAGERETLVNAKAFRAAVNACRGSALRIDVSADGLTVIDKHSRRTVPAVASVDEQPEPVHFEPPAGYFRTVNGRWFGSAATLAELIGATAFATDTESSRFALSALLVELAAGETANGFCRLVGTDGRRLAEAATEAAEPQPEREPETGKPGKPTIATALWHGKHATQAAKALTDKAARFALLQIVNETPKPKPEPVPASSPSIATRKKTTNAKAEAEPVGTPFVQLFVFDASRDILAAFTFRTVDGRFPKWRDVIPAGFPCVAVVDSRELATLAGSAVVAGSDDYRGVDWIFNDSGQRILTAIIPNLAAEAEAKAAAETTFAELLTKWKAAGSVAADRPTLREPEPIAPLFVASIPMGTAEAGTALTTLDGRYVNQFAKAVSAAPSFPVDIYFRDSDAPALFTSHRPATCKPIERAGVSVRYVVMPLCRNRS